MKAMKEHFKISQIIARYLDDHIDQSEKKYLEDWLCQEEGNAKLFEEVRSESFRKAALLEIEYYNKSKKEVKQQLDRQLFKQKRKEQPVFMVRVMMTAAAVAILVVVAVWGVLFQMNNSGVNDKEVVMAIPPGGYKATLTTSGGEKVQLDEAIREFVIVDHSVGQKIRKEGGSLSYYTNKHQQAERYVSEKDIPYNVLEVPVGGEYKLVLSDGTRVYINAGTRIKYPVLFDQSKRLVEVEGEAFFEVEHDPQWPFVVKDALGNQTEVLGTSFNVRAYKNEIEKRVTLVDGAVMFKSTEGEQCNLTPGKAAIFSSENNSLVVENADIDEVLAWKNGRFIFNDEPLSEILYAMSGWYDINVHYTAVELKAIRFSVNFKRTKDLSVLLESIEMTKSIQFEFNEKDRLLIVKNK